MEVKQSQWKAWLYLAPTIILLIIFTFYPIVNAVFLSFVEEAHYGDGGLYSGMIQLDSLGKILNSLSLDNFKVILIDSGDKFFNTYLKNTALVAIISVPISIVISLLIAVALNSIPKFQKLLQTIFFLPYVTNTIAIGMVFALIFDDRTGLVNTVIKLFGGDPISWLGSVATGTKAPYFNSIIVLLAYTIWDSLPFKILILLSALQSIDKQYYQAAQIDGTSKARTLWRITVPLLSPQIIYLMITSFIGAFKSYNSVIAIFGDQAQTVGNSPNNMATIVWFIYDQIKNGEGGAGLAAAGSLILFVIIMIITGIQSLVSKKMVHY